MYIVPRLLLQKHKTFKFNFQAQQDDWDYLLTPSNIDFLKLFRRQLRNHFYTFEFKKYYKNFR